MRSNRYTKTVRIDGAEKSKKHYSGQNYRAPLQSANPKNRKNRKQKKNFYTDPAAKIFSRICLTILLLIITLIIVVIILN